MDSSSDLGLPENNCLLDVSNNATPLETCSVTPSSAPPEKTPTPNINGAPSEIVITKKPPAKRAKKNPDSPAKPRAPRKKPTNPAAPRSRAKPSATPPAISFLPTDIQSSFLNTNYGMIQGQQQQQPQAVQRGTRVLLPKPASGPSNPPLRPAGQTLPANHVQFQNGTMVLGGGGQQQFVSFQNTNGQVHFQSDRAPTQSPNPMGAAQSNGQPQMVMMNQTGAQALMQVGGGSGGSSSGAQTQILQMGGQSSTGNVMYMGGQVTGGTTNQLIPVGGGAMMPTGVGGSQTIRGPPAQGQLMTGPGSSMTPQQAGQPGTVQVRLQVIQTANGPMTLAFFPDQGGSFNNMQSVGMPQFRPPISQQNQMQSNDGFIRNGMTTPGFNFMSPPQQQQQISRNFVSVSALAAQAQNQQSAYSAPPETKKEEELEPEFNLEEFLMPGMFTTSSVPADGNSATNQSSAASLQASQQIMDELVSGPMFQSSAQSVINGPSGGQNFPPSVLTAESADGKKKRKRPTKKETPAVKQMQTGESKIISENRNLKKVEEILKSYAEEKKRSVNMDSLPAGPFLLSSPPPSLPPVPVNQIILAPPTTAPTPLLVAPAKTIPLKVPKIAAPPVKTSTPIPLSVVIKQRSVTPPPPSPPPAPPRPKTDLAVRYEKDEHFLEKLSGKAFKGINSAVNRLLPFHLLSTPDQTVDLLDRESRAFHHVAQAFLDREKSLYSRFMEQLVSDAAEPISRLDILSCCSTWLDAEREEFEAEKRAAADGATAETRPPVWVYNSQLNLQADIPYHDGNFLLGFTEPVEDVPSPPPPLPPPPPDEGKPPERPSPSVSIVVSPEAGRLKLRIKRTLPAGGTLSAATPEPPTKIRLKFKMSAKEGWVVGRTGSLSNAAEAVPVTDEQQELPPAEGPVEDVITRSAVDSILHVGESIGVANSKGPPQAVPVMTTNGLPSDLDDSYFYGSGQFVEAMETDTALDEAINSILS